MGFLSVLFLRTESSAATVRPGFEDRMVASLGGRPMDLAFTPDGRMLILLENGTGTSVQETGSCYRPRR